jgi:cobalamin biosynthesis protein CobW
LAKVPATVITGFLGAGKTSMIRHLIANNHGRRIALIVNEFGERGVDRDILLGCGIEGCGEDDVVELANGCICCTVADEFLPTITALLDRTPPPDQIIIETSGLAMPKPLVKAFAWPDVKSRTTVDSVIAVIDAEATAKGLFASDPAAVEALRKADVSLDHESPLHELFEEQIGCADVIIMNKADLLQAEDRPLVESLVDRHARPGTGRIWVEGGKVNPKLVLDLGLAAEDDLDSRPSHHDGVEHDHDDFISFSISLSARPKSRLVAAIGAAAREFGILRAKGQMIEHGKAMRYVVQAVGPRVDGYYDRPHDGGEPGIELVVIGARGLDRGAIETFLDDFTIAA